MKIEPKLLNVQINILNDCNWKCSMCKKYSWPKDQISLETFQILLNDLNPNQTTIILSGGEPTLHPDFDQMMHLLNEKKFAWGIFTNASFFFINFWELSKAKWVRISLLADKEAFLEKVVGCRHIRKQQFFIKRLQECGAKNISGECVITSRNKNSLPTEKFWNIPILYFEEHTDSLKTKLPNVVNERGESYIIPYFHAIIDPSGLVYSDCILYGDNEEYKAGKELREKFCLGDLNINSINEIFYSQRAQDIRAELQHYYQSHLNLLNRTKRYAQKNRLIYEFLTQRIFL